MNGPANLQVDWFRVLEETRRAGYTFSEISQYTRVTKPSIMNYRNCGAEPGWTAGTSILRFWASVTGQNADSPPMTVRALSAASFRRKSGF